MAAVACEQGESGLRRTRLPLGLVELELELGGTVAIWIGGAEMR